MTEGTIESANVTTFYQPSVFTYSQWSVVGNCKKCDMPYLANLTNVLVPEITKTCTCKPQGRPRKAKAAPQAPPDTPLPMPVE